MKEENGGTNHKKLKHVKSLTSKQIYKFYALSLWFIESAVTPKSLLKHSKLTLKKGYQQAGTPQLNIFFLI